MSFNFGKFILYLSFCWWWLILPIQKSCKKRIYFFIKTLAHGYLSESTQQKLSANEYQHDRVLKNLGILVRWKKVALTLEGFNFVMLLSLLFWPRHSDTKIFVYCLNPDMLILIEKLWLSTFRCTCTDVPVVFPLLSNYFVLSKSATSITRVTK